MAVVRGRARLSDLALNAREDTGPRRRILPYVGYFLYYLMSLLLAYAIKNPAAAGLAVVFWLCRGFLPDPLVWIRTLGQISKLKGEIALNPSNLIAIRDLARIYVQRKRPRAAILLIELARERMAASELHPQGSRDDAELLVQLGIAKLQAGDAKGALAPLVEAVRIAPDVGRGDPYLVAANALMDLKRWEEAEDALDRFLEMSSSSIEGHVKLARVRAKRENDIGSIEAINKAKDTWHKIPAFKRRQEWTWYAAAIASTLWL